jgi:hypothetical protein
MMVALVATMKAILLGDILARPNRKAMLNTLLLHLRMVRLTAMALATVSVASGCLGEVTSDSGSGTSGVAKKKFKQEALPFLKTACIGCHGGSSQPLFLAGSTDDAVYDTIVASTVVNFSAVGSSRVIIKGQHSGPALTSEQSGGVLSWLEAERDERANGGTGPTADIETLAFATEPCRGEPGQMTCPVNTVALDAIGAPGATLTFTMENLADSIYLKDLAINAGPTGVFIEHPLFVAIKDGRQIPDGNDTLVDTKLNVQTGSKPINGGRAIFSFPRSPTMKIVFRSVKTYQPEGGGPGPNGVTGCKKVDSFFEKAASVLQTSCVGCHAGGSAKSAVDMSNMGATDATLRKTQCDQILTSINKLGIDNSSLFRAPSPDSPTHPFKFPSVGEHDAFKNPIKTWINEEIVAQ